MADILTPDLCIIGGGSGGLTVAAAARAFDASVVLIEKADMGGDCLNTGCIPSKSLIAAAGHAASGRDAHRFGVSFEEPKVNFGKVYDHIRDVIEGIRPHDSVERFEALGATVIKDHARFVDKKTVQAGDTIVRARRFVIATGSRAAVPPIPGIETVDYFTNETVFEMTRKPGHLIIIGGGPIGMELAQAYRRLGAEVTIVEMATPLAKDDPELTAFALGRMEAEGVTVHAQTGVTALERHGQGVSVTLSKDGAETRVNGTHLLVAAGQAPNIEDMGLDAARVKHAKTGIAVNDRLRTSNRRIYAIGDVAGGMQFTHLANYHAGLVVRSALFGLPARQNSAIVPWVTYTDPEIANVGLTEAMARDKYGDNFRVVRWSFADNDRARAERRTDGLVKLIASPKGEILGCGIAGAQAGEMISLFAYAMANGMKMGSLLKFIAPYPTLSENAKRLGTEYYRDKLDNPWLKRWLNFIRMLP